MKLEELLKDAPDALQAVTDALARVNANEPDKLKHVRFADLSEGEYVSKAKLAAKDAENQTNAQKLAEANTLIEKLQKAAKGDEALQGQVTQYQTKVQQLEEELAQTKIDAAIKVGLLAEDAADVDYLTYKLKEKGDALELDEQGNIKGWADKVASLKTQLPTMFKAGKADGSGGRKVLENNLPEGDGEKTVTKEQFRAMGYAERLALKQSKPEQYNKLAKG